MASSAGGEHAASPDGHKWRRWALELRASNRARPGVHFGPVWPPEIARMGRVVVLPLFSEGPGEAAAPFYTATLGGTVAGKVAGGVHAAHTAAPVAAGTAGKLGDFTRPRIAYGPPPAPIGAIVDRTA